MLLGRLEATGMLKMYSSTSPKVNKHFKVTLIFSSQAFSF